MREALLILLAVLSIIAALGPVHRDYMQASRRHKIAMGFLGSCATVALLVFNLSTSGVIIYIKGPSIGGKMGASEVLTVESINISLEVGADQGEIFTLRRDSGEEMRVESKDFLTGTDEKVTVGDRLVRTVNGLVPVKLPCVASETTWVMR